MNVTRLLLLGLALSASTVCAADTVRLCTARPTGTYAQVGAALNEAGRRHALEVQPVESEGSMDNLAKLAQGVCDAAIVQADAYMLYQQVAVGSRLEIRRPTYLYDEMAHLVCRDDVGARRMADLLAQDAPRRVAIGEPGGGSGLTFGAFGTINDAYRAIQQVELAGQAAIDAVTREGGADCLFHVSAPGSPWIRDTVAATPALSLVAIEDRALAGASIAGIEVYVRASLGVEVYPGLMPADARHVDTIAVRAVLVALDSWAGTNEGAFQALLRAAEDARPSIERLAAGR